VISKLRETFDWVICDSPAGIEHGALCAMRFADAAVIVTNPQVSSIRDSIQIIDMLNSKTQKSENGGRIEQHLLITRFDELRAARDEMLRIEDVLEFLPIPLLGIIPESKDVLRASNVGSPVTLSNKRSTAARAYIAAANKLNSERFESNMQSKRSLMDKLFGRKAAIHQSSATVTARPAHTHSGGNNLVPQMEHGLVVLKN
jgi:septum site-determining protein MinD